jgi:hypothetical protein
MWPFPLFCPAHFRHFCQLLQKGTDGPFSGLPTDLEGDASTSLFLAPFFQAQGVFVPRAAIYLRAETDIHQHPPQAPLLPPEMALPTSACFKEPISSLQRLELQNY